MCHYWYSLDKGFKFQPHVCNSWHSVLMMPANHNDIAILNIKGGDYCCICNRISKSDAINVLRNADLTFKRGIL